MKQISIIIPALNEAENILKLFKYFDINNIHPFEVIIADNQSSYDYHKLDSILNKCNYLKCKKSGRAQQMNEGAKIAKGDILMFLHADVLPPITYIEDILTANKNGFSFGFFAYKFSPTSKLLNINANFTGKKGLFVGGGDQIHFINKSLFIEMGGYNEKFVIMEDFDFFQRFKKLKKGYIIIQNRATVSSRKYIHNSYLKVNLLNLIAFALFHLNFDIRKIKRFYENGFKN